MFVHAAGFPPAPTEASLASGAESAAVPFQGKGAVGEPCPLPSSPFSP